MAWKLKSVRIEGALITQWMSKAGRTSPLPAQLGPLSTSLDRSKFGLSEASQSAAVYFHGQFADWIFQ
jgi:hypothetical protein